MRQIWFAALVSSTNHRVPHQRMIPSRIVGMMREIACCLVFLLIGAGGCVTRAHAAEWVIDRGEIPAELVSHYQSVMLDQEGKMTIEEAFQRRNEFERLPLASPVFGFTNATIWSCLHIRSQSDEMEEMITRLGTARLSHVTWYLMDSQGKILQTKESGAVNRTTVAERLPIFSWNLAAGAERWLFIRIKSDTSIWLPIRGGSEDTMKAHEIGNVLVDALLMGFCAAIAIIVLIIGLIQRHLMHILFALVIFFYMTYFAVFNGYLALVVPGLPIWWEREFVGIIVSLMLIFFALFNARFLLENQTGRLARMLHAGAMIFPVISILNLIFLPFASAIQGTHICALLSLVCAMLIALCFGRYFKDHAWYGIAWVVLAVMMIFFALQFSGVIPIIVSFRHLQLMAAPFLLIGFLIATLIRQQVHAQMLQQRLVEKQSYELINHISAGTYEVALELDAEGAIIPRFIFTSAQYRAMFDITEQDLEENPYAIYDRFHPEDLARLHQANLASWKTKESFRWEGRLCWKGKTMWIDAAAEPRINSDGITVWSGLVTDITRQKRAQDALRRTLENLPVAIACDDLGNPPQITMINEQFFKTFGYALEDIPNVAVWSELAYPDPNYRQEIMNWWFEAVEKANRERGQIESRELIVRCKDGSDKEVIISTTMLEDGPVVAFLDITERNRSARELEALRTSREKSAFELTENMPAGTYALELRMLADEQLSMFFRFVSRRFLDFFQVTREQIHKDANRLIEVIHPEDRESMIAANLQAYETTLPFYWQGRTCIDGQIRWLSIQSNPRMDHSGVIVWEGVVSDITSYIDTESKLQESLLAEKTLRKEAETLRRAAERAHEAKSLFLAKMSHEIRTPLSALVSLSQAMWMRGQQHAVDAEFTPFLNRVRSGGQYLNLILRNVLNISAAESGRVPVHPEEFYVADWVADVQNILEPIADYYRGQIEWSLPCDDEARWCTDQMRLTQIALNLCENALKYSVGQKGLVCFGVEITDTFLNLTVSDVGPGIPAGKKELVFAAFSQVGQKVSPLDEGVGLGLAIVKINTVLLHGEVRIEDQIPQGMKFVVRLPRIPNASLS